MHFFSLFLKKATSRCIQARPDLSIQDITALFVSLTNLSLSCYPDRLEYVDQVLVFAAEKIKEFADKYIDFSSIALLHLKSIPQP